MSALTYWKVLTRRKTLTSNPETETKFNRVLGTFDLTALGVGATLGVGVYVLAGHVARDQAGPSVVLSFAIAAIASLFAGLCYAEFGARVPKAGSAYIYSYVCIGEFAAFIIGWNLILEYVIGSASVSRGISLYLDTLINDTLKVTFSEITPINWGFMASYFDLFAFSLAFFFGIALAFGVRASTVISNIFTIVNIGIVLFVIIGGAIKADPHNWKIDPSEETKPYVVGFGGFFPFGFGGTLKGAATCFFGFVGFDCIATTGEEVRDPRRAIPRSILFSLLIIFLSYFGVSTVLTLMWPYYLQDVDAPLPYVFKQIKWPVAQWIVTIGGLIGLISSLFGAMFPLPRIIYAMSQDGLIFRQLGNISPRFKTPIAGNIWAALLTGLLAALFDLTQLVNMLSIGTLMAYTVVAISVTILRFMYNKNSDNELNMEIAENTTLRGFGERSTFKGVCSQMFNCNRLQNPSSLSTRIVGGLLFCYCLFCFGFSLTVKYALEDIGNLEPYAVCLLAIFSILLIIVLLAISMQPREKTNPIFRVPFVPFIPGISIFINIYLMLQLDVYTWIRFGIWMIIGIPIYLFCTCMYNKNEVRNTAILQNIQRYYENGKITFKDEDSISKSNGAIKHDSKSSIQIKTEDEISENKIKLAEEITQGGMSSKTTPSQQSLDEILSAEEVITSHKEVKNSNGKTIFIEENSSKDLSETKGSGEADAKSILAILDDVLQTEDSLIYDGNFIRKTSVDSEMIPSFVETSTVAMIHSSCDSLKEEEGENESCNVNECQPITQSDEMVEEKNDIEISIDTYNQKSETQNESKNVEESFHLEQITIENIERDNINNDDSISSEIKRKDDHVEDKVETISNTTSEAELEEHPSVFGETYKEIDQTSQIPTVAMDVLSIKTRKPSQSSEVSVDEDAVHSKTFKDKLNNLLSYVPPPLMKPKIAEQPVEKIRKNSAPVLISFNLKPSKSEPDILHLFKNEPNEAIHDTDKGTNEEGAEQSNIPKAPKFDPILYKTIGSRMYKQPKERPKLDVLVPKGITDRSESTTEEPAQSDSPTSSSLSPIPFKKKLEKLLKSGPSFKVTKMQPKSNILPVTNSKLLESSPELKTNNQSHSTESKDSSKQVDPLSVEQIKQQFTTVLNSINNMKVPSSKEEKSLDQKKPATTIEEARQNLRHVHVN